MVQGANCRREEEKDRKRAPKIWHMDPFVRPVQEAGAGCKEGQADSPFEGLDSSSRQV